MIVLIRNDLSRFGSEIGAWNRVDRFDRSSRGLRSGRRTTLRANQRLRRPAGAVFSAMLYLSSLRSLKLGNDRSDLRDLHTRRSPGAGRNWSGSHRRPGGRWFISPRALDRSSTGNSFSSTGLVGRLCTDPYLWLCAHRADCSRAEAVDTLGASADLLAPPAVAALKSQLQPATLMRSMPVMDETSLSIAKSYEGLARSA